MEQSKKAVQAQGSKAQAIKLAEGNWDEQAEQALASAYTGRADNDKLGSLVEGKSAAAVRSKLVSLGIYEKNEPKSVGGASSSRKIESVRAIEAIAGMGKGTLDSLEKARKDELETLAATLAKLAK